VSRITKQDRVRCRAPSRGAHLRGQYRRAVIDAATALEIALYKLLLDVHRSAPSPLADELLRSAKRWTLRPLRATVARVCDVPSSISEELVTLRNDVVHKTARQPTRFESAAMISGATDAVTLATPADAAL
jgi:hypothetical protein